MIAAGVLACAAMVQISFHVPGVPLAFARAGRNGKTSFTPPPQKAHMLAVAAIARGEMRRDGVDRLAGPLEVALSAVYPHPRSWSRRRIAETFWKTSKPDADNLVKIVLDALSETAFADDASVVRITADKSYGAVTGTWVRLSELAVPEPAGASRLVEEG